MLTLFVMHPLEALGFGSLWVITLTLNCLQRRSGGYFSTAESLFRPCRALRIFPVPEMADSEFWRLSRIAEPGFHFAAPSQ
jgi:hypothetical protein